MKILILGAGQVGSTVAQCLASEANDITVIDRNQHLLSTLQERTDIRTITGQASHPDVLQMAGIEDADMILAVTSSDEINMVACQIAHSLFHTPLRLARVRSRGYLEHPKLFSADAVPINFIFSPEQLIADFINHLIEYPGVMQVIEFANGRLQLMTIQVQDGAPLVGHRLRSLGERVPGAETRVVSLFRRNRPVVLHGDTAIEAGDEIILMAQRPHIAPLVSALHHADKPVRRVIIAGGGNIGKRLAETIEPNYHVKLIELEPRRCRALAEDLHRTIVLNGDAADQDLLRQEKIGATDMYCAVTNDDEVNILSAILAKQLGARKVLSVINRTSYIDLAEASAVDIALSPALVTIGALRAHILRGDIVTVHSLRGGTAEVIELVAHGDPQTSRVVARRIDELPLPAGVTIGAIIRGSELIFPRDDTVIETQDHVIAFLADKSKIGDVERLFQVSITYI